jgi:hypothetical protein
MTWRTTQKHRTRPLLGGEAGRMIAPWVASSTYSVQRPSGRWCLRIFNLQPRLGRPGPINRSQSLAYDPFQPELTDSLKHAVAMTFGVFDY